MITAKSSLTDIAFEVCTALGRQRFTAVLTGGSAATYYAPNAYQSLDLDFVITFRGADGEKALHDLGFRRKGHFYVHARSAFSLDFPVGPLAIGEDLVTSWDTIRRRGKVLHLLTPTDSCRDRLASYLFWNDLAGLEQAIAVYAAQKKRVSLKSIAEWCRREGQGQKFELYERRCLSLP